MGKKLRVQILLEPGQHNALEGLARQKGKSISALTREIIGRYLADHDEQFHRERAIQAIREIAAMQ